MSVYVEAKQALINIEASVGTDQHCAIRKQIRAITSQSVMVAGGGTEVLLDALFTSSTGATEVVAFWRRICVSSGLKVVRLVRTH